MQIEIMLNLLRCLLKSLDIVFKFSKALLINVRNTYTQSSLICRLKNNEQAIENNNSNFKAMQKKKDLQ